MFDMRLVTSCNLCVHSNCECSLRFAMCRFQQVQCLVESDSRV